MHRASGVAFLGKRQDPIFHLRNLGARQKICASESTSFPAPIPCMLTPVRTFPLLDPAIDCISLTRCAAELRCSLGTSPPVHKRVDHNIARRPSNVTSAADERTFRRECPTTTTPPGLRLHRAASRHGSSRSLPRAQVPDTVFIAVAGLRVTWTQAPARP